MAGTLTSAFSLTLLQKDSFRLCLFIVTEFHPLIALLMILTQLQVHRWVPAHNAELMCVCVCVFYIGCDISSSFIRAAESEEGSMSPRELLSNGSFYILWFIFLLNGQGVSFISSLYKVGYCTSSLIITGKFICIGLCAFSPSDHRLLKVSNFSRLIIAISVETVCKAWLWSVIGGSCHKYHFCRNRHVCHDKTLLS